MSVRASYIRNYLNLFEELPTKKRRTAAGALFAPSTAPLRRKRFNPTVQSTAAAMMSTFLFKNLFIKSSLLIFKPFR